jgi:hypothetical protein
MARANVGDRVKMTGVMFDDPCPMEVGAEGTVTYVNESIYDPGFVQIMVDWDNGRSLILLGNDPFIVTKRAQAPA